MLKELSKFFESKDKNMDVSTYCAHSGIPYSKQQISKVFKSYKKMMAELIAMPQTTKTAPKVKVAAKAVVSDSIELSVESGK